MNSPAEPAAVSPSKPAALMVSAPNNADVKAFKGLLWGEWLAHSKLILFFLGFWLLGVWIVPLFTYPGWILLLGALYAFVAGPLYGGADLIEGCEEFTLSLPPTRSARFLSRALVGGGTLLILTALDLLALGLDLPQILARLYVDTGLIQPASLIKPGLLYGLVVNFPLAVFAFAFALSSAAQSRLLVVTAWFWSGLVALTTAQLGFFYEELVWEQINGYVSCPLLLFGAMASLWCGYRLYLRKEIGHASVPLNLPTHWWLWLGLFAAGLCLALALISSLAKTYPRFLNSGTEQLSP